MARHKSPRYFDDGDDAHFDGNPAYRKRSAKRRLVGAGTKLHGSGNVVYKKGARTRRSGNGKTTSRRKRVAGK